MKHKSFVLLLWASLFLILGIQQICAQKSLEEFDELLNKDRTEQEKETASYRKKLEDNKEAENDTPETKTKKAKEREEAKRFLVDRKRIKADIERDISNAESVLKRNDLSEETKKAMSEQLEKLKKASKTANNAGMETARKEYSDFLHKTLDSGTMTPGKSDPTTGIKNSSRIDEITNLIRNISEQIDDKRVTKKPKDESSDECDEWWSYLWW